MSHSKKNDCIDWSDSLPMHKCVSGFSAASAVSTRACSKSIFDAYSKVTASCSKINMKHQALNCVV